MKYSLSILFITMITLIGCASDVNEAERLEECILDGNVNNNCEISTLEHDNTQK